DQRSERHGTCHKGTHLFRVEPLLCRLVFGAPRGTNRVPLSLFLLTLESRSTLDLVKSRPLFGFLDLYRKRLRLLGRFLEHLGSPVLGIMFRLTIRYACHAVKERSFKVRGTCL